jgi:TonB family protein
VILEVTDRIGQRKTPIEVLNTPITVDLKPYVQEVKTKVLGRWYAIIPDSARGSMRMQANVAVQFAIHHDGVVAETTIASSSGDAALDDAASKAVNQSSPFSPLPNEVKVNQIVFLFRFQYNPPKATGAP